MKDYRTRAQKRKAGEWRRSPIIVEIVARKDGGGTRVRPNRYSPPGPRVSMNFARLLNLARAIKRAAEKKATAAPRTPTKRGT